MMQGQFGQMGSPMQELQQELGGRPQAQPVHHVNPGTGEAVPEYQELMQHIDYLEQQLGRMGLGDPRSQALIGELKQSLGLKGRIAGEHMRRERMAPAKQAPIAGSEIRGKAGHLGRSSMPGAMGLESPPGY